MAGKKQSRGNCVFCGREMTKGGLSRHLKTCPKRQEAVVTADAQSGRKETIFHLQVLDAWGGDYWLHMEMRGDAELYDLDQYLRSIWLECCGHLSAFEIDPYRYTQLFDSGWSHGNEKSMHVQVRKLFASGQVIPYEYDFGTTSELLIKVIDSREGKALTQKPLYLMARNQAPQFECQECKKPAAWLCLECIYEDDQPGLLCEQHAENHPHEEYDEPLPLENSPRTGMCAYSGPAEPPY